MEDQTKLQEWLDSDLDDDEDLEIEDDAQQAIDDLIEDGMKHMGNNRYHMPKAVAKAKRKAAKKAKQKQRRSAKKK